MKKILIGMFAFSAMIFSAGAQETRKQVDKPGRGHGEGKMITKDLNLTEAQKEQMKVARETYRAQLAELEKNENITVKEYKTRKAAIHKEQKEKMDNLLTAEQKNRLATRKHQHHGKGKHDMHKGANLEVMKSRLNLSDDQVSRLKASQEKRKEAFKAIKDNQQLSEVEKKAQMKALKEESKAAYKSILTPEQFQKMEEMKKDKPGKQK
jgi:Spy/CpxP family protein refolding chaperone